MTPTLSPTKFRELYDRRLDGWTTSELADEVGMQSESLTAAWRRLGLPPLPSGPTQSRGDYEMLDDLYRRYMAGEKLIDLAAEFCVTPSTLCQRWRNRGFRLRIDLAREPEMPAEPEPVAAPVKSVRRADAEFRDGVAFGRLVAERDALAERVASLTDQRDRLSEQLTAALQQVNSLTRALAASPYEAAAK